MGRLLTTCSKQRTRFCPQCVMWFDKTTCIFYAGEEPVSSMFMLAQCPVCGKHTYSTEHPGWPDDYNKHIRPTTWRG